MYDFHLTGIPISCSKQKKKNLVSAMHPSLRGEGSNFSSFKICSVLTYDLKLYP